MREIPLTLGQVALVDDEDFARLSRWRWQAKKSRTEGKFYATRQTSKNGKRFKIHMHREIMGLQFGDPLQVDHIDPHATLDNRKSNLRIATFAQQQHNTCIKRHNSCGYKGVTKAPQPDRYIAKIVINKRAIYLGTFDYAKDAHEAYKKSATAHFGEFARAQ